MSEPSQDAIGELQQLRASSWALRDAARTPKSVVPPEISDYIIEFLHDNNDALRQCSLVCRDWVPSSSLHLFERLWWPPCYHAWCEHGLPQKQCKCSSLNNFNFWSELLRFVEGSQRVRDYVRTLRVSFHWVLFDLPGPGEFGEGMFEYRTKITLSDLVAVLDKLPHLQWLYLLYPRFVPEPAPVNSSPNTRRTWSLRKVTLDRPTSLMASDEAFRLLIKFLRLFRRISFLQLKDIMLSQANYHPPLHDVSERPDIAALQIEQAATPPVIKLLRTVTAAADPASLSTLVVHNIISEFDAQIVPLLRSLTKLQTLGCQRVQCSLYAGPEHFWRFP